MIINPLNLADNLRKERGNWDWVPYLSLLLIVFFISMFGTRFISAPGVDIDLPVVGARLLEMKGAPVNVYVLTIKTENMLLFEGSIYSEHTLVAGIKHIVPSGDLSESTLLIKMDKGVNLETFMSVAERLQELGFKELRLAVQVKE